MEPRKNGAYLGVVQLDMAWMGIYVIKQNVGTSPYAPMRVSEKRRRKKREPPRGLREMAQVAPKVAPSSNICGKADMFFPGETKRNDLEGSLEAMSADQEPRRPTSARSCTARSQYR